MKTARIFAVALLIIASGLALSVAHSQQTAIKRTELQRHDLSIPGREVIQVRGDFPPGAAVPRHTHPGEELVYVLEGTLEFQPEAAAPGLPLPGKALFYVQEGTREFQLEARPPVTVKAGEVFFTPAAT